MSKSFLDNIFDVAESALDPLEKALSKEPSTPPKPASQKQVIDVESDDERSEDWEKTFSVVQWATVNGKHTEFTWHAFPEGKMTALCGEFAEVTHNRQVLEHGKTIAACTSCIIAVSK